MSSGSTFYKLVYPSEGGEIHTTISSSSNLHLEIQGSTEIEKGLLPLSVKVVSSVTGSLAIDIDHSISSTYKDPWLDVYYNDKDPSEIQWLFEATDPDVAGRKTLNFKSYYVFELLENSINDMYNEEFYVSYEIMYETSLYGKRTKTDEKLIRFNW